MAELEAFEAFIKEHHILTLATSVHNHPQCATLFYVFDAKSVCFIVASSKETEHIQNALENPDVAGAIALETQSVGTIQGLQFKGILEYSVSKEDASRYFKAFPYARAMKPTFWCLHVKQMKLTDNRLGFGKKIRWENNLGIK